MRRHGRFEEELLVVSGGGFGNSGEGISSRSRSGWKKEACSIYYYKNWIKTGDEPAVHIILSVSENTVDKHEHKPATKTSGTGKGARGSQKPIGPTPMKAGVGRDFKPRSA